MDLTNASAIVTGGAGGFGSATVRRLAQPGARVVIADVSDERGEALDVGAGSLYVPTGGMDEDAIAKAVKAAAGLGPLRAAVITDIGPDWPGGRPCPLIERANELFPLLTVRSFEGIATRYDE
jgi:NAD(P)-dependent dehydrogenase (short-subunit alcohol dehydrogenase family)